MSTNSSKINLTIICGVTFSRKFILLDAKRKRPLSLLGYSAHMQVRESVDSLGDPLLDLSTENGGIVIDASEGSVTLNIPAATTSSITWKKAEYDLNLKIGEKVIRLLGGYIVANHSVTKS